MADRQEKKASAPDAGAQGPKGEGSGRLDLATIRQLLELMTEHDLVEIEIEQEDLAVRLRKAGAVQPAVAMAPVAAVPVAGPPAVAQAPAAAKDEGLVFIKSPIVGTFYAAASPDAEPYVKVGDHVTEDAIVCMVEAMKVFNEIRADVSGTIEKILMKNAEPVEFGHAMFAVRPD